MNNPCDDGLACNGLETCTADGEQAVCADAAAGPCAEGEVCDEVSDECFRPCTDDTGCSDNNLCNGEATCDLATERCVAGTPLDCDDGDTCTVNSCDPVTGCLANPLCDDGDACTTDTCDAGVCDFVDCEDGSGAGDGNDVGTLRAETQIQVLDFVGETETFTLQGSFFDADSEELENLGLAGSGSFSMETQTQQIGGCTVGTQNFTLSSDGEFDQTPDRDFGNLSALDPGDPGIASVGASSVNLLRGIPPRFVDLPAPILAGAYAPSESSDELIALGFGASQTIAFSFPGGADLDPFSISLDVPAKITVTSPDLSAGILTLDTSRDWDILWVAGNLADTMRVVLTRINADTVSNPDGSSIITGSETAISCEFADVGMGTIPAGALALLPAENASGTTAIVFIRERIVLVSVPRRRVAGDGVVRAVGSTSVFRQFPGIDTSNLCALITCPEGEVCNPETFQCDPE